jgi:YjbE family integral membrane protein
LWPSFDAGALGALASVVIIDLVLAGDNAIVVGMAAAGLAPERRRRVILAGIGIATLLRIGLSFGAVELLEIIGLTLAGGILLLWVAWKFYRELRPPPGPARHSAEAAPKKKKKKTFGQALWQVVAADVSMSLDNVLAIAGAAREHPLVLALGLLLSVALMGLASALIARLLGQHRWLGWLGLAVITAVALHLIYEGSVEVERAVSG